MGMTLTEKILAHGAGLGEVKPGELLFAKLDLVMGTDVTVPLSVKVFREMGAKKVFDPAKIAMVNDHFQPAKDIPAAELSRAMRAFAEEQGIIHYFEVGRSGICHVVVPDKGLVVPGDIVIGADSHTCTYGALGCFSTGVGSTDMAAAWALGETWFRVPESTRLVFTGKLGEWVGGKDLVLLAVKELGVEGAIYQAIEYAGPVVEGLPMSDRFTLCNMAVEAGAKSGVIRADDTTVAYVRERTDREFEVFAADPDARYARVLEFNVTGLEPQVALPHLPSNVKPISEVEPVPIDQVVIGSCTNGRIEDFRIAAGILKGRQVHRGVRCIILPGSQDVYYQMVLEGLAAIFLEAGAAISTSTCGPCIGGHMGVMTKGERAVFTTSRNFRGRTGHRDAEVYLSSPAVAAASAVLGRLADPRELA